MAVWDDILQSINDGNAVDRDILDVLQQSLQVAQQHSSGSGSKTKAAEITVAGLVGEIAAATVAIAALPGVLAAAVSPFVEALNPGLMLQFNTVFRNLLATVGNAFTPVIGTAIRAVQTIAQQILPLTEKLKPLIAAFTDAAIDMSLAFSSILIELANSLRLYLLPLKDVIVGTVKTIATVLTVFAAFTEALNHTFLLFIALSEHVERTEYELDSLRHAIVSTAGTMIQLNVILLRLLGLEILVDRFNAALKRRVAERDNPTGGLVAAPRDAGVSGIEEIAKQAAASAFVAVSGDTFAKSDSDVLKEISEAVDTAANADFGKIITNAVYDALVRAKDSVPGSRTVQSAIDNPQDAIPFGRFIWDLTTSN